jgi:hypothetical protein
MNDIYSEAQMKSISEHFASIVEEGVKDSLWFQSAPAEFKATAVITILGVEDRKYSSMIGSAISLVTRNDVRPLCEKFLKENTETKISNFVNEHQDSNVSASERKG